MKIIALEDGPLMFNGPITLDLEEGESKIILGRIALCRCGASEAKPLCDGAHKQCEFRAPPLEMDVKYSGGN